jgi:cytidylate kinase
MSNPIIIAIDGYSSCGKSTLARQLAADLGYRFIDTGAMYRAVTLYFLKYKVDISNHAEVEKALDNIHISFDYNSLRQASDTILNNVNVELEIRSMEVAEYVSKIAAIPLVRKFLVKQQQAMGHHKRLVMDGRDIGTVVFPHAELKLFMIADTEVRTMRRYKELQAAGRSVNLNEVRKNLAARDLIDTTREDSPLKKAPDAILMDNSFLSREEQYDIAFRLAKEKIKEVNSKSRI